MQRGVRTSLWVELALYNVVRVLGCRAAAPCWCCMLDISRKCLRVYYRKLPRKIGKTRADRCAAPSSIAFATISSHVHGGNRLVPVHFIATLIHSNGNGGLQYLHVLAAFHFAFIFVFYRKFLIDERKMLVTARHSVRRGLVVPVGVRERVREISETSHAV